MKVLILLLPVFFFFGCNKISQVELRSIPEGAKVYDKNTDKLIAKTPATLTYVFDSDPKTPECEIIPPLTVIWGAKNAVITEKNIIICPNRDYKITLNQYSYKKTPEYRLVEYKEHWSFTPYFGINTISSGIDFDITDTDESLSSKDSSYLYKLGFVDNKNNRLEINYSSLLLDEKDLNLYSLDTVIPILRLKDENVEPYFKFGLGYANYTNATTDYTMPTYSLGFGFYGYITKSLELEVGLSSVSHLNYGSFAEEIGFNGIESVESKLELTNILMGFNYKF